jgi:hypothetical protein
MINSAIFAVIMFVILRNGKTKTADNAENVAAILRTCVAQDIDRSSSGAFQGVHIAVWTSCA